MSEKLMTRAGLERLQDELHRLTTVRRQELADRIRHAVSTEGNLAENAEYLSAREEQAFLERRIALLHERIEAAEVVEPDGANGVLDVGELVRLRDLESGEVVEYELVGTHEADPSAGKVSAASPLGRALLGGRAGDVATVEAPKGPLLFEILGIDSPAGAPSR